MKENERKHMSKGLERRTAESFYRAWLWSKENYMVLIWWLAMAFVCGGIVWQAGNL